MKLPHPSRDEAYIDFFSSFILEIYESIPELRGYCRVREDLHHLIRANMTADVNPSFFSPKII
jgi:hypothetical protein